jgi:hypothetical protein
MMVPWLRWRARPSCPGHFPVPLHSLEHHREALRGRRGALLVPHAELGHGRPPPIILAKRSNQDSNTFAQNKKKDSNTRLVSHVCIPVSCASMDSCNVETKLVGETETYRFVVLRGGGPRTRSRRRVVVLVVLLPRRLVRTTVSAAAVLGQGRVVAVSAASVVLVARPRLVLRRRRELALLGAPASRLAAAAAPGPPVGVGLPVPVRPAVDGLADGGGTALSGPSSGSLGLYGRCSGGAVAPLFSRAFSK